MQVLALQDVGLDARGDREVGGFSPMKRIGRRSLALFPALSINGRLVHLATRAGATVCSSKVIAVYRVRGRVSCRACTKARPVHAARHAKKPLIVGLDYAGWYKAVNAALRKGARVAPPECAQPIVASKRLERAMSRPDFDMRRERWT
jgi:hypothetical protein